MKKENKSFKLFEQEAGESGPNTPEEPINLRKPKRKSRPGKDSVDDQIDALILRYESASIRKEPSLNESLKSLNLRFLLEQEEELPADDEAPPVDEPAGEEADAEDAPEPEGSEKMTVSEPADNQEVPDIDIDKFGTRIVRLISSYQNLLNVEEAILNRAKTFLDENYGDAFVQAFVDSLIQNHGIESVEFKVPDVKPDNFAVGAYAGGTGGLGGGGA
jgi:hypothetical protein